MLVRLPRAPVQSGGLTHKTQLFSGTLYMTASSKTPPHQSKGPQKFKTWLRVPVFPGSSLLCRHTSCEKTTRLNFIPLSPGLPQDFVASKIKDNILRNRMNVSMKYSEQVCQTYFLHHRFWRLLLSHL
ncbi:hypothetical protein TNCT_99661 [Trichonephila clavata]|uniref:Uncharacterized protein n=1 Tax=Trichonephila clavata TaxID=2740835 RepID=A0A8X6HZA1_TRICU|nr:hypothetical protein TNCT_99661 [Trichonephila clavata]